MAKRKKSRKSGSRKSGRLTKAEIKKAGGIKQAWRARKSGKRAKVKSPRRAARRASAKRAVKRSKRKSATRRRKARKAYAKPAARKRRKARKSSGRRRRKSGSRGSSRSRSNTTRTNTRIEKQLVVRHVPAGGLRVVGTAPKRKRRKGKRKSRRTAGRRKSYRKGQFKKGGGRRKSSRGAMENPMGGGELFVGFLFGAVGFMVGDAIDRGLATHALTDTGKKNAAGQEIYGDPQAADGPYKGLYNATAICAPMSATRWVVGILGAAVPITVAHFVSAPLGRAGLQFFGFAFGVRIVGKGLIDLMAIMTRNTEVGQRLYDGEMRAILLKSNGGNISDPNLAFLPQSGLGRVPHKTGVGNCACQDCTSKTNGVGYPSMPRIVDPSGPPPPPPPLGGGGTTPVTGQTTPGTTSSGGPPPTYSTVGNNGPPRSMAGGMAAPPPPPAKRNPFTWGYQE